MLQVKSNNGWLLQRQIFRKVLLASTLSLVCLNMPVQAQSSDNKKPGLEPVAASSPASKSAMGESPSKQSSAQLPKPEAAKTSTGSKGADGSKGSDGSKSAGSAASQSPGSTPAADKPSLPFPVITSDALNSASGVQAELARIFPSAIDIHGSAAGVLLHARRETRYDLLSPLSIWLEEGPLLVSVRRPSDLVLVATKFGDICVTAGGDALVERGEEDTLRIVNLSTANDTVFLNMHDKLWTGSPWGHMSRAQQPNDRKGKKLKTYENIESGAVAIAPGYELVIGAQSLSLDDVKPPDSVGRREFRTFEGGRFVIAEISIDNLTQLHDLIKNLGSHGEKAGAVFADIMKNAAQLKSKQGESGFEKNVPKPIEKKKPPVKVPPKPPTSKPKPAPSTTAPSGNPPAETGSKPQAPPAKSTVPSSVPPSKPQAPSTPAPAKPGAGADPGTK